MAPPQQTQLIFQHTARAFFWFIAFHHSGPEWSQLLKSLREGSAEQAYI